MFRSNAEMEMSFECKVAASTPDRSKAGAGSSNVILDDDSDDESYVPESLRNFLKEADMKLEADLSFLSPPTGPSGPLLEEGGDGDDDAAERANLILKLDLAHEMEIAKSKDLERAAAMKQEAEDQEEREQMELEFLEREQEFTKQKDLETSAAVVELEMDLDQTLDREETEMERRPSPLLDIIHPSADVSQSHLKRIAMEGTDYEEEEEEAGALQPLVAMVEGNAASPMIDCGVIGSAGSAVSPPPSATKVGRKLQMELDAEAQRASLDISNNNINRDGMEIENADNYNDNKNKNESLEVSLDEHRKSMNEKQQRLRELQLESAERRQKESNGNGDGNRKSAELVPIEESIQKLSQDVAAAIQPQTQNQNQTQTRDTNMDITPSIAAAAAASEAAAVVATNDEGPIAIDVPDAALVAVTVTNKNNITKSTAPLAVEGLASQQRQHQRELRQQQSPQKHNPPIRNFRTRKGRSPPRPKEIITRINFSEDGRVSPLGGEGGIHENDGAVSPLASPISRRQKKSLLRDPQPRLMMAPSRNYNGDDGKPLRPSPSRRRQLTRPDSSFDRLSRPTATRKAGAARKPTEATQAQHTKINAEEEQRKARERIRKRMAMQRQKAKKSTNGSSAQPIPSRGMTGKTLHNTATAAGFTDSEKSKKTNARKERMEELEKERLAKIKAKIEAKEERLQLKKKEEIHKNKLRLRQRAAFATRENSTKPQPEPVNETENNIKTNRLTPAQYRNKSGLTIPVAPKFATDRRVNLASTGKKTKGKGRVSLASQTNLFGQGLRSETPWIRSNYNETPRRLTIPKAPKFATSQRFGQKAKLNPMSSPTRKNTRDSIDNISWSSMLRDMSGIASPVSKCASSIKTGPLTIPITPQFQSIRKRPLPKSLDQREKEEMLHYKEHPFKAIPNKMNQPQSSSRHAKPTPKRILTTFEPFRLSNSSKHTRSSDPRPEAKEEASFKALPMPDFKSQKSVGSKKSPPVSRPLTTPEPFRFHATSTNSKRSLRSARSADEASGGKFKALPLPNFKSSHNRASSKKLRSPQARPLTTPEPFKLVGHATSKKREETPVEETKFKARRMPNFSSNRKTPVAGARPKSGRKPTTTEPFHLTPSSSIQNQKQRTKYEGSKKISRSVTKTIPSGASGLLFQRSFTASSRLSRPKVVPEPPKPESHTFRARPLPDFIPEVIVTRTPVKGEEEMVRSLESTVSEKFHARPMPSFDKVDIPVIDKDPSKLVSPSRKISESPVLSPAFKASPAPKNMLDEPSIPVRRRDPKKLRSPTSQKKLMTLPSSPKSPGFRALPVPDSLYDDPPPIRKHRTPDRMAFSPIRDDTMENTTRSFPTSSSVESPPQIQREDQESRSNVMEDAKARLRDRLSKRRSNAAAVKAVTPNRDKSNGSSKDNGDKPAAEDEPLTSPPHAFSTLRVKSLLHSQSEANAKQERSRARKANTVSTTAAVSGSTEITPRKSNSTIPKSIDLPLSAGPKEKIKKDKDIANANVNTIPEATGDEVRHGTAQQSTAHLNTTEAPVFVIPKLGNTNSDVLKPPQSQSQVDSEKDAKLSLALAISDGDDLQSQVDPDKDAALLRETKLALALGIPDGDESSSILQLAQEVQKAAEDELSFYGSVDTRSHWSSSLADGRPHNLL